jgi:hypothetical protein
MGKAHGAKDIKCPFLRLHRPRSESLLGFCAELQNKGVSAPVALTVGAWVAFNQPGGWWNALTLRAPDIYKLDQVAGVSHSDLFLRDIDFTTDERHLGRPDKHGRITFGDILRCKRALAKAALAADPRSVVGNFASQIEDVLLFIRSQGDPMSGLVRYRKVVDVLVAKAPNGYTEISFATLLWYMAVLQYQGHWSPVVVHVP